MRKLRVQAVARLARFSMADAVGQDDEVLRRIQQLARSKQDIRESWAQQTSARASGSVSNQYRIVRHARGITS